jgi:putative ATP-dependent endonuclease of the OLD family
MKLRKVSLQNFRCYQQTAVLDVDDMTVLVGRNDAGKSALLDGLNIFFGNAKLDTDDRCKHASEDADIVITCEFEQLPTVIDIDAGNPTTLQSERLLTDTGRLSIKKIFKGKTPTLKGVFAVALHPTNPNAADLLSLKRTQLKERAQTIGANLEGVNQTKNAELRAAIRATVADLQLQMVEISLDKEDAKTIWEKIDALMPVFALFKSDRDSKDGDEEAQNPLNAAVAAALKDKQAELDQVFDYVSTEVQKVADATLAKLRQMDATLANQLQSQFERPTWHKLFKASIVSDAGIPVNKRGSGVRRLILINFFRAKAERLVAERKASSVIYAVEEPETSQHPSNQRLLVRALQELLQSDGCQVMLTTHTPILARVMETRLLRYVRHGHGGIPGIEHVDENNWQALAHSLGVLPETTVELFMFVEGKHDIPFLMNLADALRADGANVPDLRQLELDGRIIFAPLGGSNLLLWTNRIKNLLKPEFHVYDRDNTPPADPKYKQAIDAVMIRAAAGEPVHACCTSKKEMENYVHIDAINEALQAIGLPSPRNVNYADTDDVPRTFTQELNAVLPAQSRWKEGTTKAFMNNHAVTKMNRARLAAVDPANEVLGWFQKIEQMLQ